MKAIIVYNSKTGFSKRYAEWAAEELGCEAVPYKGFDKAAAGDDGLVVFFTRIQAGRIDKLNDVKKLLGGGADGRLVVAAVGAAPASAEDTINKYWADTLTEEELAIIPHFYMQGGLDFEKMGFAERSLLKMAMKILKNKKDKTDEESIFEEAISGSFDNSSRENIGPLVEYVRGRESEG